MAIPRQPSSLWGSLSKLASPGPRKASGTKGKGAPREDPLASFLVSWDSLQVALSPDQSGKLPLGQSSIPRHLGQILALLVAETPSPASTVASSASEPLGPCQEHLIRTNVLSTLVSLVARDDPPGVRRAVIVWAKQLLVALGEGFIVHSAVHRPLVRLLRLSVDCEEGLSNEEEEALVDIMGQISQRIQKRPELLAIFFREKVTIESGQRDMPASLAAAIGRGSPRTQDVPGSRPTSPTPSFSTEASTTSRTSTSAAPRRRAEHDFLLFAFLLRFVHREGSIGDLARAGLVCLVDVAVAFTPSSSPASPSMTRSDTSSTITAASLASQSVGAREARLALGEYLLDSDFAEVLGAGLGALYGLLPSKLLVRPAGSSPTPGAWDDDSLESGTGGMVLGGMGALEDLDNPDETRRKMEEEEDRLLSLGVGLSGTPEFRDTLDGYLKLVEFTQDVVRRASMSSPAVQPSSFDDMDAGDGSDHALAREQRLVTSALQSSILASVKKLFLAVLYTSILECSESDGSAVAVLSYLDALLAVVQEGGPLEGCILGFLLGEDDSRDAPRKPPPRTNLLAKSTKRVKRRKSSALVLLESRSAQEGRAPASAYFIPTLGRFSLKDLLASTVHSQSAATSAAALKLLQTMLSRHDRWSMGLLDIVLDEGATFFPSALREDPPSEPDSPNGNVDSDSDSDDSDVFVYPTGTPTGRPIIKTPASPFTPARLPGLLLGTPLPATPSINHHLDSIDALLDLLEAIDPAGANARNGKDGAATFSTGFASYVQDAEAALAADAGFQRGIAAGPAAPEEPVSVSMHARRRSTLFGVAPSLSAKDFAAAKTAYRHRLEPRAALLSLLLDSLAQFFSHPPEVNLSLTAVLSTLALCPYRSLDGWMLPAAKDDRSAAGFAAFAALGKTQSEAASSDDGDDRSVDHDVDDLSRHDALFSPNVRPTAKQPTGGQSLLAVVAALAASVAHYRATILKFDQYLGERRAGLHFVDNLADALDVDDDGGNAFEAAVRGLGVARDAGVGTPAAQSSLGPRISPRNSTPTERDVFMTPPRHSVSTTSLASTTTTTTTATTGVASPFAAHYRQTGAITVTPIAVGTARAEYARSTLGPGDEDDGAPDSPTKRLSPAPAPSVLSDDSDPLWSSPPKRSTAREMGTVTLSTTLDNVLVLEEFVKELTAILLVRRGLGIDGVRFL